MTNKETIEQNNLKLQELKTLTQEALNKANNLPEAGTSLDTSDATATADDILFDKTAYVNNAKITGNIPTVSGVAMDVTEVNQIDASTEIIYLNGTDTEGRSFYFIHGEDNVSASVPKSLIAEVEGLTADKLLAGNTVLGIEGNATGGIDTSDATAIAEDIALDKTAYVNGQKITGTVDVVNTGSNPTSQASITGTGSTIAEIQLGTMFGDVLALTGTATKPILYRAGAKRTFNINFNSLASLIGLSGDKIVKGNTIIGVTGTANMTPTYSTVEELPVNGDATNGDIAVVNVPDYGTPSTGDTIFAKQVFLPLVITLDEEVSYYVSSDEYYGLVSEDSSILSDSALCEFNSHEYVMEYSYTDSNTTSSVKIEYTSEDGITYTRTNVDVTGSFGFDSANNILTTVVPLKLTSRADFIEGDIIKTLYNFFTIPTAGNYVGTYKYNRETLTWEPLVSETVYEETLTPTEYDEATVTAKEILGTTTE